MGPDPDGADAVLRELRRFGRIEYVEADFERPEAPADVVGKAVGAFGHLDVLVVNHARSGRGRLHELTAGQIDAHLHENVGASLLLVKEFAAQHDGRPGGASSCSRRGSTSGR